jgi:TetR/AcrR family transcriptional regulator
MSEQRRDSTKKSLEVIGRAEHTRQKLLNAGINLFSLHGYGVTSTRQIETAAGVKRNLMTYHFGTKKDFWKACIEKLFKVFTQNLAPAFSESNDIEPVERLRFLIRRFVRASAQNPTINRIMLDEGKHDDWRLKWIVDNYASDFYSVIKQLQNEAIKLGVTPKISTESFYYLLVGSAAMFSMAPECILLTGNDPNKKTMIDAHANAITNMLITPS